MLGSYAGAMGNGQFMPRSYRTWAVDGDGDGKRDLWGSWPDVIASVANYLADHGWRAGEPVVAPASLWFPKADGLVPGKLAPDSTVKALRDRGLAFETTQGAKAPALFITRGRRRRAGAARGLPQLRRHHALQPQHALRARGERPRPAHRSTAAAGCSAPRRPRREPVADRRLRARAARACGLRARAAPPRAAARACDARAATPPAGEGVPRDEPRAKYGNPPFYEVDGRRYVVLPSAAGYVEQGVASWYGPDFHGGRTATGETYDMHAMTGAHPTLPLPTWVRVTNLENGRSVVVRLNDRGPFARGRIIDLSRAAAEALDMVRAGTARVEVQSLATGARPGGASPAADPPRTTPRPAPSAAARTPRRSPAGCAPPASRA